MILFSLIPNRDGTKGLKSVKIISSFWLNNYHEKSVSWIRQSKNQKKYLNQTQKDEHSYK